MWRIQQDEQIMDSAERAGYVLCRALVHFMRYHPRGGQGYRAASRSFAKIIDMERVCEFAGVERWNGTVEWTTGVEYWSATPTNERFAAVHAWPYSMLRTSLSSHSSSRYPTNWFIWATMIEA